MCMACSSAPTTADRFSRAAFSEPGRFRIRLRPRVPATARDSMARGVMLCQEYPTTPVYFPTMPHGVFAMQGGKWYNRPDQNAGRSAAGRIDMKLIRTVDAVGHVLCHDMTQITEGAVCDLFISAAPKQMNQLDGTLKDDAEKNPDGLDLLVAGSRIDLLENKVALAVAEGNDKGIDSFDKLADLLKNGDVMLAIGNSDVPVGQYTQKIFKFYDIDENAIAAKLTYGSNVKEVTTAVSEGTVDCGIIYASDAYSAGLTVAATATAEMCGQVIYPAAVLNTSEHQDAAAAFLTYLQGAEASAEFEAVLFTPLSK